MEIVYRSANVLTNLTINWPYNVRRTYRILFKHYSIQVTFIELIIFRRIFHFKIVYPVIKFLILTLTYTNILCIMNNFTLQKRKMYTNCLKPIRFK